MIRIVFLFLLACLLSFCSGRNRKSDAYGNFESVETIISSEVQGVLLSLQIQEGQSLIPGQEAGMVDTIPLYLKKAQLMAQRRLVATKLTSVQAQVDVLEEQKKNLLIEMKRAENLIKDNAIPEKQLDDLKGNLRVLESQIVSANTQKTSVLAELDMVAYQILQLDDQIHRSRIVNPVPGIVLEKYIEVFEMLTPGKPVYKIAFLDTIVLRAYVSGDQLSQIALGDQVEVLIDQDKENTQSLTGIVSWISQEAEFTPKIIQTKKERVNLVYAVKVNVPNDGRIKTGMPGEMNFIKK